MGGKDKPLSILDGLGEVPTLCTGPDSVTVEGRKVDTTDPIHTRTLNSVTSVSLKVLNTLTTHLRQN